MGQGQSGPCQGPDGDPPSDAGLLAWAAKGGDAEVAALFLQKNPVLALHAAKSDKWMAAHHACQHGHAGVLQLLISAVRSLVEDEARSTTTHA